MPGSNDMQNAWIGRVLGVQPSSRGGRPEPGRKVNCQALWRDAKEAVDDQLNALAGALRSFDDPDLERIADFGLFGIGRGENVALAKALTEYETARTGNQPRAAANLRKAIAGYRAVIVGNDIVKLIDGNPFGVTTAMAATLGGALDQIERTLG